MAKDYADRATVRADEKQARIAERRRQATVRALMSTIEGRYYVFDKLDKAHIFHTSFSLNALQMAFNEGERNQGLQLYTDIMQSCPEQFPLMMGEAYERSSIGEQPGSEDGDRGDQAGNDNRGGSEGNSGSGRDPDAADPHGYYKN